MNKNNYPLIFDFELFTSHLQKERHPVLPGWRFNIKTIRI
jgi:hypothetical protein